MRSTVVKRLLVQYGVAFSLPYAAFVPFIHGTNDQITPNPSRVSPLPDVN